MLELHSGKCFVEVFGNGFHYRDTCFSSFPFRLSDLEFVVEFIPIYIFDESIQSGVFVAFLAAESEMFAVCFRRGDEPRVAWGIPAILAIVGELVRVEALPYRGMGRLIAHLGGNAAVEGIEIAEPVPVIVRIDVFHHASLERIHFLDARLVHDYGCLFTADSTRAVPDDFLSFGRLLVAFQELRHLSEIGRSSRDSALEMSEPVFVIVSHIENDVVVRFTGINDGFEFFRRHFLLEFFDLVGTYFHAHRNDFLSIFHGHLLELVPIHRSGFHVYVGNILEISGRIEICPVRPKLALVSSNGRRDAFRADVYPPLESKVMGELPLFFDEAVGFGF